jgi:hypothetical protein
MAFTVEDGTGLANSNAYIAVQTFKDYHKDRGNVLENSSGTPFTNAQIEDAIVKASDYMDRRFRGRYVGRRKNIDRSSDTPDAQRMEWPRIQAYDLAGAYIDEDSIPIEISEVCAEYAFRALSAALAPDPVTADDSGRAVVEITQNVGPIETTTKYAEGGLPSLRFREYPEVDALLSGLVLPKGRAIR